MVAIEARERVRFLLQRAGFGEQPERVAEFAAAGLEATVKALLDGGPESIDPPQALSNEMRLGEIRTYWLHRMVTTRHTLVEKMTLFWHGHFATGVKKASPLLMQRQNELMRSHALGAFPALLREMAKDGAMLLWLDGAGSTRKDPNENYAREVMELFTTGPGPYSETDIQEAARAFTGWRVSRETGAVAFDKRRWDPGDKTVLGATGPFGADEVSDLLAGRPETPRFLAEKLWRFFASPVTDSGVVAAMANAYTESGGEIRPMLRTLFLSDAFYADAPRIKSPVELVAGTLRVLGLPVGRETATLCTQMGQALFDPPNVAGWPGHTAWLGATTLLARWNLGEAVRFRLGKKPRTAWLEAESPADFVDHGLAALGMTAVSSTTRDALLDLAGTSLPDDPKRRWETVRNLIRAMIAAPEYQVV